MIETLVVIAYNRDRALARLLASLNNAYYEHDVNLVISIDKSNNRKTIEVAENFVWLHGKKELILHKKNMGLRNHVMYCGELTEKYGTICVFEDDLYVSKNYFIYSEQVVNRYSNEEKIAGFSLYCHPLSIESGLSFSPIENDSDVFALQYAMSWGQIWTRGQWEHFYKWYLENQNISFQDQRFPSHLSKWPDSSWLKYFISYCIVTNKFFIYPYNSLTTNFSDIGTHSKIQNLDFQVKLEESISKQRTYVLPRFKEMYKYDSFFEFIPDHEELSGIEFDLYGCKKIFNKNHVISCQNLNFEIIKSFGLNLKPHEMNILHEIEGDYFKLYDLSKIKQKKLVDKDRRVKQLKYYYGELKWHDLLIMLKEKIKNKI